MTGSGDGVARDAMKLLAVAEVPTILRSKELRGHYRATLDVPSDLVSWLENLIAARRSEAGGSWRVLTSWDQAVMLLVRMARGDSFPRLAAHFGAATDTA